jgi:hypothetical protein
VVTSRQLREEARICRELMRDIKDRRSIAMFRDRAEQLERSAAALEPSEPAVAGGPVAACRPAHRPGGPPPRVLDRSEAVKRSD